MKELPPYRRYETLAGVEYEILNSKKTAYYTVPLVNGKAAGCECKHVKFAAGCRHQIQAELEERLYQNHLHSRAETVQEKYIDKPLNGVRGFALMR